ncbi:MAG: hypothetical protein EOP81_02255 [Variovorax sp.]|nr:MAG: hypothetical protein EOP81_02255 [Variovorax sp.]
MRANEPGYLDELPARRVKSCQVFWRGYETGYLDGHHAGAEVMTAPRIGNAQSAINKLRQQELDSRRQATTILQPSEVSGGLSPARMLTTTLGGTARPITPKDLAQWRLAVQKLGAKAQQGLSAREALSLSTAASVERAKKEISFSLPVRLQAGKLHLVTDSGPQSKVTRHHVHLEFAQYSAALARPGTPAQAAQWLCKESPLKFECDCGHFRYFLRYVASAGGWVAGRYEGGLPKLTNPTLDGAACKHLIRVLTDLQSSVGLRQRIAKMVEADRELINRPGRAKPRAILVAQAEAERMLPKHSRRIVVPSNAPRHATLVPKVASADVRAAMAAFRGKTDANSIAVMRALQALAAHTGGGGAA